VDKWKAADPNGKLTEEQQAELNGRLISMTINALPVDVLSTLDATLLDVRQIILNTGEAVIAQMKMDAPAGLIGEISDIYKGEGEPDAQHI
jgi:hypothetical protein